MGRLSTHVLDIVNGKPAAGMRSDFAVLDGNGWRHIKTLHTNADGRKRSLGSSVSVESTRFRRHNDRE